MQKTSGLPRAGILSLLLLAGVAVATPAFAASTYSSFLGPASLGYVSGAPLEYQHAVTLPSDVGSIQQVTIDILLADDSHCSSLSGCWTDWAYVPEAAVIEVNGHEIYSGQTTIALASADITGFAGIDPTDGLQLIDVKITPLTGDFEALISLLRIKYDSALDGPMATGFGQENAIPEPSAALAFAAGLMILSRGMGRRRR